MYDRRLRDIVRYPHGEKIRDFHVPTTLEDYRAVYRGYLHDPDLQDARARWPFVSMWDNHEFSWLGWQSLQKFEGKTRPAQTRKVAANQAFFEFQPARMARAERTFARPLRSAGSGGRAGHQVRRARPRAGTKQLAAIGQPEGLSRVALGSAMSILSSPTSAAIAPKSRPTGPKPSRLRATIFRRSSRRRRWRSSTRAALTMAATRRRQIRSGDSAKSRIFATTGRRRRF